MTQLDDLSAAPVRSLARWSSRRAAAYPTATTRDQRVRRLVGSVILSMSVSSLVVVSSWQGDSRLGVPLFWTWVLTGLQVVALWAAGRGRWWAWLLGAGVQPVWIVYAVLTGQVGFVPGCLLSMAVQLQNFLADRDAGLKPGTTGLPPPAPLATPAAATMSS